MDRSLTANALTLGLNFLERLRCFIEWIFKPAASGVNFWQWVASVQQFRVQAVQALAVKIS